MFRERREKPPGDRAGERREMVESQIAARGVRNEAVLNSMRTVPRHLFVPEALQEYAYRDSPLPIGEGQTISQPYIVALMAEALEPRAEDRVLEIGTGSGYAAAILSRLVSMVYTIERREILAKQAQNRFRALQYDNIIVRVGDGTKGWPEEAPFDGILITAGAPAVPRTLGGQLKPGGRMVLPVGYRMHQSLLRLRLTGGGFTRENLGPVCFVPLIGEEGWDSDAF
ncbi:MAG: protein-L-isoaspartate(D-aspartate) O-methyltransferase [Firmicutes bacterium]|nr:protein-L-isoaspartate(D-aspartate) O-methyltransferase [Bacillota bacterium]